MANEQALEYFKAHLKLNETKVSIYLIVETKAQIHRARIQQASKAEKGQCGRKVPSNIRVHDINHGNLLHGECVGISCWRGLGKSQRVNVWVLNWVLRQPSWHSGTSLGDRWNEENPRNEAPCLIDSLGKEEACYFYLCIYFYSFVLVHLCPFI